jgi:hypothetical protein
MSDDYMHWAWQLKMIKEAERKLKEGQVTADELRRQVGEFVCRLFNLVICPNSESIYSGFQIGCKRICHQRAHRGFLKRTVCNSVYNYFCSHTAAKKRRYYEQFYGEVNNT